MPTIQDVAKLAGVSPTTAKRALREAHKLSPGTLQRVQQAIAALHYEPDERAGALRGGKSQVVGLVVGSITEPFFAQFARVAAQELRGAGYTLIITENEYSAARELEELRRLYAQRVAGVLLRSGYGLQSRDYLRRLQERGVVIVEYDYSPQGSPFDSFMLNNPQAIELLVNHLHGLGHQHIASLGSYHPALHPEARSQTFLQAMHNLGLVVPPEYQQVMLLTEDNAYAFTRQLLSLPRPPTALIALTGTQCIGAFRAIRECGLRIPEDISLVGFDNYRWTGLVEPAITVVEQPIEEMARAAARHLVGLLAGPNTGPSVTHQREVFAPLFIPRSSTAPPAR